MPQQTDHAPSAVTLVVDVANTVGARPDGWWRDRVAATERLLADLAALHGRPVTGPVGEPWRVDRLVAVLEGQARDATAPTALHVVRAEGSGDDALVAHVIAAAPAAPAAPTDQAIVVVTADRGLRARLPDGTTTVGPGWLRTLLDTTTPPP